MRNRKPYNPKRFEWKFYQINPNTFFYQTYNQGPTLRACPEGLRPFLVRNEPVAHTSYKGLKEGYITTYLVQSSVENLDRTSKENGRILKIRTLDSKFGASNISFNPKFDDDYNIFSRHINLNNLRDSLIQILRDDVVEFCHRKAARESIPRLEGHYTLVDKIEPNPKFTPIKPKKNELVKLGKGFFHDICAINIGLDFSRGCVSNITPEGIYDLNGRCDYCYAYQNGPSFLETLYDFDEGFLIERLNERIEELKINKGERVYLRIGQTTEANIPEPIRSFPGFKDNLKIALNALTRIKEDYDLRIAMPTKIPDFDGETIEMFRKLNISIFASIGYKELERGIVRLGYPPEKRLEKILELGKMELNANIYIATDITNHNNMQENAKMAIDFYEENKKYLGLQFLDVRITNKNTAGIIGGECWSCLKYNQQQDMFSPEGNWVLSGQNYLQAHHTDPYFLDLIGDNKGRVRLCSTHVSEEERRCGMCFMDR